MIQLQPSMSTHLLVTYLSLSSSILLLSVLSFIAMYRTKKTPKGTKLLSLGLLTYDMLFIIFGIVTKLFEYNDVYMIWHASRGFQFAAQFVVCCMALERLFVLNWPYVYLRVMTERRIKVVCTAVIAFGFLHYALIRGTLCYARNMAINCGLGLAAYLLTFCIVIPAISFISFIKIYKIIRKSEDKHRTKNALRQYKGTVAAFLVLVNTTISQIVWLGLSVLYFTRTAKGQVADGFIGTLADWSNLVNCIVDPAIYVIWFNETRMELMKLLQWICPCVKPKIEKLRIEIYQISFTDEVTN